MVTLIREINLISRNQLSLAKSTYKNIILNNYAKMFPEHYYKHIFRLMLKFSVKKNILFVF